MTGKRGVLLRFMTLYAALFSAFGFVPRSYLLSLHDAGSGLRISASSWDGNRAAIRIGPIAGAPGRWSRGLSNEACRLGDSGGKRCAALVGNSQIPASCCECACDPVAHSRPAPRCLRIGQVADSSPLFTAFGPSSKSSASTTRTRTRSPSVILHPEKFEDQYEDV
jgi:hypothetical protein